MSLLSINHHYIRDIAPPSGIHPISLEVFQRRVAMLLTIFGIVSEQQLIASIESGKNDPDDNRPRLLLTFDDGLAEQMSAAIALERLGIAGVFFVPTAPLADGRLLLVHKTHLLRSMVSDQVLLRDLGNRFGNRTDRIDRVVAARQYIYDVPAAQHLKYVLNFVLTSAEGDLFINDAFDRYCGSETAAAQQLYMSRDDIRWLAAQGMLGTHTHSHRPLAQLSPEDIKREIELSIDILQDITRQEIHGISYPYGGPTAVSDEVYRAAHRCGLRYGFTMIRGRNSFAGSILPLALRRYDTQDVKQLVGLGTAHPPC